MVSELRDTETQGRSDRDADDESFLARWSRRKQADGPTEERPSAGGRRAGCSEPSLVNDSQQAVTQPELTDEDMPPVESLDEKSDYAAFMSPGISEQLRAEALRRLFHLPGLHVPDGLDDYAEDFTQFAELGDMVPHEMRRMLLRERQAAEAKLAAESEQQDKAEAEADSEQHEKTDRLLGQTDDAGCKDREQGSEPG